MIVEFLNFAIRQLNKYLRSDRLRQALWCRGQCEEDSCVHYHNHPLRCWLMELVSVLYRAWTICDVRLDFYVFSLGMTSVYAQTHPPLTMLLSINSRVALTIWRRATHVSWPGIGCDQGHRRDMRANPKIQSFIKFLESFSRSKLTLKIILLCSDRDFVFWKCSRRFLKASSSNLSVSSSSSPNDMCPPFRFDFFDRLANSLRSSLNGFELLSDSRIGLKVVRGFCCWSFGEFDMLSAEVSMTTVSRLVEVVEFDNVPSVLTRL